MASLPLHATTFNLDLTTSNPDPIVLDAGANDFSFASFNVDYLIVGGGGTGGGVNNGPRTGGGGGAGGLLTGATSITGLQNITVGAGGSNAGTLSLTPSFAIRGTNGGNSVAFGFSAIGGGAGGTNGSGTVSGLAGGSGGGAGTTSGGSGSGGAGTVGQGTSGAAGAASPTRFGGGGGGAGGAASGSTNGAGSVSSITGTAVTYAAGGNGGLSGSVAGAAGAENTGNGGNGASGTGSSTATTGGNGGSGIVVASYTGTTQLLSGGTVTNDGINTIHTFTTTGAATLDLHSATINGDISGTDGDLLWNKTGTLTLGGTNSYTGTTTISSGTLKLGANDVIPGTSNVSIGTATLDADTRTDTTIGTLDVTGAATINLGSGAALAFADSKLVDWTGGTLDITGTLGATSLRFGDSADDLDPSQLAVISVNGGGLGAFALDVNGYLFQPASGPVDSFVISAISSPQTVGTPITGITIIAKDSSNFTATSFNGTVTFGGTGGFSGPSGSFIAGVLSGVSVTPTVAGSNLTFTVDDGDGHTGSTTIATINSSQTPYQIWATGGELFDDDANNDGVDNGLAFLLGASSPTAAVTPPTVTQSGGDLILNFNCLPEAARGSATLRVEHSSDLGLLDPWTATTNEVPDETIAVPDNNVTFEVDTVSEAPLNKITATIDSAAAAAGKLFGRLEAVETP